MIVFLLILIVLILCMGSKEFNAMAKTIGLVLLFAIFFVTGINIIGRFYTIMICLILGILLFVKTKRC